MLSNPKQWQPHAQLIILLGHKCIGLVLDSLCSVHFLPAGLIVAVIALSDRSVDVVLPKFSFKQRWFPHVLVAKNYQIEGLNCVSSDTEITQAQHQESLECLSTRAKTFVKHLEEATTSELPRQPWDPGGIEIRRVKRSSVKINF